MIRLTGRNRQGSKPVWAGLWASQGDAIGTCFFITALALLSLALTPARKTQDPLPDDWHDLLEREPAYYPFSAIDFPHGQAGPGPGARRQVIPETKRAPDGGAGHKTESQAKADPGPAWQSYRIRRNDTLGGILRLITEDTDAINYLVTQDMASYRKLRLGRDIEYRIADGALVALRYKASQDLHLNFTQDPVGDMQVAEGVPELTAEIKVASASITEDNNSLFAASDDAGIPDAAIQDVIEALETRIDFQRSTRLGDKFAVVYELLLDSDGETAGIGKVLALSYLNKDGALTGLLAADGGYYEPNGESLQRAFLRSPLKFSRISSRYSNRRFHPVLKKWRSHRGVDFAAPTNTPVRSSADGTVDFVGRKGGYGNVIMIKHFGRYLTVYGHLNKFASKIKKGGRVSQGQVIGYVGSTGLATGPHLHYEFRVDGKHKDPLSVAVPINKPPLDEARLAELLAASKEYLDLIKLAG